ncbi:MAG: hypothetical protein ACXQTS_07380 [Candidatus Methanospirareceae archaeon]
MEELEGIGVEEREYLKKVKIRVLGGGIIVELLKRFGFKEIKVMESEIEDRLIYLDPFYNKEHINTLPKYSSIGNTCISSFPMPDSVESFKRILRGGDVLIGSYSSEEEQRKAAFAASELGMPFITYPIVTTILPDGIGFEELDFPPYRLNPLSNIIIRSLQISELIKLFTGINKPFFPPNALEVEFDIAKPNFKVKKIRLKKKIEHHDKYHRMDGKV